MKQINPKLIKNFPPFVVTIDKDEFSGILKRDTSRIKVFHYLNRHILNESGKSYKQSVILLQNLKQNIQNGVQIYLGEYNEPSTPLLPELFGYRGVIFRILYDLSRQFIKDQYMYSEKHPEDYPQSQKTTTSRAYNSPIIPEFDERWSTGLPITFVYLKGNNKPFFFDKTVSFDVIQSS